MNSALVQSLGSRWPNNVDSDDSEDDDVLPQEECWTLPDDGWTLVKKTTGEITWCQVQNKRIK